MATDTVEAAEIWSTDPIVDAHWDGGAVEVRWPTRSARIPLIWLRDNCPCDECHLQATGEHRFFLGAAPTLPAATAVEVVDGILELRWSDQHTSRFRSEDLATLAGRSRPRHRPVSTWSGTTPLPRFGHGDVLRDVDTRIAMLRTLGEHGAVVVTGAPTCSGACGDFIAAIGAPVRETPFDRIHDVLLQPDGYNVAHTAEALPPHTDFASYTWPPSGQVLHMLVNEAAGGDSIVLDGWRAIHELRARHPNHHATLCRVRIPFREHADRAESWTLSPIIRTHPDGSTAGIRFSNQLMQPLPPEDPEVEAFYDAYHALSRLLVDDTHHVRFRLEAGDMMILNGHRVLHGRTAFDPTSGARHLQDTYFELDDIWAEAERLEAARGAPW